MCLQRAERPFRLDRVDDLPDCLHDEVERLWSEILRAGIRPIRTGPPGLVHTAPRPDFVRQSQLLLALLQGPATRLLILAQRIAPRSHLSGHDIGHFRCVHIGLNGSAAIIDRQRTRPISVLDARDKRGCLPPVPQGRNPAFRVRILYENGPPPSRIVFSFACDGRRAEHFQRHIP